ncbi:CU044_5270 family protein [Aeromicrobium sp.]|uniref:CU044_5270 family protein n=1 Tax=Aeromicrobium sp. TaxID=1871063 RepID=UPI002FC689B7
MSNHDNLGPADEIDALRDAAREAGFADLISPESVGVQLDSADAILARAKATEESDPVPIHRRRRTRLTLLAAGAVAATTALVLGIVPMLPDSKATASTPPVLGFEFAAAAEIATAPGKPARDELERLSTVAAGAPSPAGSGTTQKVVTDNWFASIESGEDSVSTVLIPRIVETYLRPDGSFRTVERTGKPLSPDGRGLPKQGTWDDDPKSADETLPEGTSDPDFATELPLDPNGLVSGILKGSGCRATSVDTARTNCLFRQVNALYSQYVVTPKLASAIWAMMADQPGVRLLGAVDDRAGRSGIGFSLIPGDEPHTRFVLIVSPATGQLLGSENILIKPDQSSDVKPPAITSFTAILDSRYTTE